VSLTYTVDVWCDAEGCWTWIHGMVGHGARAGEARARARAHGWRHVAGNDYCPDHIPEDT
jgi:hypothetical protein